MLRVFDVTLVNWEERDGSEPSVPVTAICYLHLLIEMTIMRGLQALL
jgi:hypothetical protein